MRHCPYEEFAIRADSSGFVTIISITNDEFEEVLKLFPKVKARILKENVVKGNYQEVLVRVHVYPNRIHQAKNRLYHRLMGY